MRRTAPRAEAEDIVQECFLRAVRSPPQSQPRAWLYRVAVNVLRDHGRREQTARAALEDVARAARAQIPDPAAEVEAQNLVELARRAVARLPERQRMCLFLRLQRHMDYDEIATALECTVDTARQHFFLAVKAVRDRVGRAGDA